MDTTLSYLKRFIYLMSRYCFFSLYLILFLLCLHSILPTGNEHSLRNVFTSTTACMRHHSKFKAPNLKRAPLMIDQLRLFIYPAVHPRCNRYLQGGLKGKRLSGYLFLWRMCFFSLNCRLLVTFRSRTMCTNFLKVRL